MCFVAQLGYSFASASKLCLATKPSKFSISLQENRIRNSLNGHHPKYQSEKQVGKRSQCELWDMGCAPSVKASFLQTAQPCVIFQIRLLDRVNPNNVSTHIVLGQQPGDTFKMSVFAEIHMICAWEESTSARGTILQQTDGEEKFHSCENKTSEDLLTSRF